MKTAKILILLIVLFVLPFTTGYASGATYSVSGTVTSEGTGLMGVPVTLSVPGNTPTTNYVVTTTDNNGNYVFTGVSNGTYWLSAFVSGYTFSPSPLVVTVSGANVTGQNLTANYQGGAPSGVLSGKVVDLNGAPIPGVMITAYHTNNNLGITTTTDVNGEYSFTTMCTGDWTDYQIYAEKPGFGFYPSLGCGSYCGIIDAGYNGLERTVIHFPSIPTTPLSGADFTAYRPGDKVISLPRTGQTISYVTGDDASANKGVAWPAVRFTDNKDGTVTDNLTGLIWMKNAGCFAPGNWYDALTEANQLVSGQCGLTDGSTAGQWRMPNANELESIVDISQSNPSVSSRSPFININLANPYWSSSTYMAYTSYNFANTNGVGPRALAIQFTDGAWVNPPDGSTNTKASSLNSLWAVKSGPAGAVNLQATGEYWVWATGDDAYHSCPFCEGAVVLPGDPTPAIDMTVPGDSASLVNSRPPTNPRMIDNGDGTISDTTTGLTWLKQANCIQGSWADAVAAVNNLASGQCGLTDGSSAGQWRMPNRFEMLSLAIRSVTFSIAAYYDSAFFANLSIITGSPIFTTFEDCVYYWTSSTYASDPTQAWTVFSGDFGAYNMSKSYPFYTMAVRETGNASTGASPITYNITASSGTGGTISPEGITTINSGGSQTYTIIAATGYYIAIVTVDNISVGAVSTYIFSNVTATHNISATFSANTVYSISGTVSTATGTDLSGVTITISGNGITPMTTTTNSSGGYSFSGLSNGTYTITPTNTGGYTFTAKNVTVKGANQNTDNFTGTSGTSKVGIFIDGFWALDY